MLPWRHDQRSRVNDAIVAHPIESGRCADLSRQIRPDALALDPGARAIAIRPQQRTMRYVATKHPAGTRWFHHVTTHVLAHRVDALTGADGIQSGEYLSTFFEHPEALQERAVRDEDWRNL